MRLAVFTFAMTCILASCANPGKDAKKGPKPPQPPAPVVTPLTPILGKVVVVNADLKYVVVDFALSRQPTPGDLFGVFRMGMKVGEVRINDLSTAANFAADITAGEVKAGDEVRKD